MGKQHPRYTPGSSRHVFRLRWTSRKVKHFGHFLKSRRDILFFEIAEPRRLPERSVGALRRESGIGSMMELT